MIEIVKPASTGEATEAPEIKPETLISADSIAPAVLVTYSTQIMQQACLVRGVRWRDVLGKRRYAELAAARQWCCLFLFVRCELPVTRVGRILGLDHASVEPLVVDVPEIGRIYFPEVFV